MTEPTNLTILYPAPDEHDDDTPATKLDHESCTHRKVRLDTEARRVFCRKCNREVDPFTIIQRWAGDWTYITNWRVEAERRRLRADERLEEVLRLERNARSRLKKLDPKGKPPEKPWGEGSMHSY